MSWSAWGTEVERGAALPGHWRRRIHRLQHRGGDLRVTVAAGREPNIEYALLTDALKGRYQDFTEARMERLRASGWNEAPTSIENAVTDYVQTYLATDWPHRYAVTRVCPLRNRGPLGAGTEEASVRSLYASAAPIEQGPQGAKRLAARGFKMRVASENEPRIVRRRENEIAMRDRIRQAIVGKPTLGET